MTRKVCMFVTNSVTHDPRVRRESATLVEAGYQVVVFGVQGEGDSREDRLDGCPIIRFPQPRLMRPRQDLLALFARTAPGLYDSVRAFYRRVRGRRAAEASGTVLRNQKPDQHTDWTGRGTFRSRLRAYFERMRIEQLNIRTIFWLNLEMAKAAVQQQADIFHAHDLDTLLAGYLAKLRTGKKLVYDFHELYTEQFEKGVRTQLWHRYYSILERILVKRADVRLTVCDSLGEWVSRRYRVNGVMTVKNVPSRGDRAQIPMRARREKVILYQGLFIRSRGLEQLVESARYLQCGRIIFRGYGDLEQKLRALVKESGVEDRVSFAPPVPMIDLVRVAAEADIGVAPFVPVCLNTMFCLPNKLFEYMMAGLAIAGSDLPEMRKIILGHDLGVVFNPEEPKDIARAINELLADDARLEKMRRNSLCAAQEIFNWELESPKLVRLYNSAFGLDRLRQEQKILT